MSPTNETCHRSCLAGGSEQSSAALRAARHLKKYLKKAFYEKRKNSSPWKFSKNVLTSCRRTQSLLSRRASITTRCCPGRLARNRRLLRFWIFYKICKNMFSITSKKSLYLFKYTISWGNQVNYFFYDWHFIKTRNTWYNMGLNFNFFFLKVLNNLTPF